MRNNKFNGYDFKEKTDFSGLIPKLSKLLKKYRTVNKIKEASLEELNQILPESVSINLQELLKNIK